MPHLGPVHVDERVQHMALLAGVTLGAVFAGVGALVGSRFLGFSDLLLLLFALAFGVGAGVAVQRGALLIAGGAGSVIAKFVFPTGDSTPYEMSFSAHDALAIRGDTAAAIAAYDATMAQEPENVRAKRQAAELHVQAGDAGRAASLFLEMRRTRNVTPRDELYATQRLADLYSGALGDEGRALVELRRIVERFPTTTEAKGARIALDRLKGDREEKRKSQPDAGE